MIIECELTDASLEQAIQEIEEYRQSLINKTQTLAQKLGDSVQTKAYEELSKHIYTGETISTLNTTMSSTATTSTASVQVAGAAIWLEFGTGVVANATEQGNYVHPLAEMVGMSGIGTYGNQRGADPNGWWYMGADGQTHHTYGIPATMFLYKSLIFTSQTIPGVARGVFFTK